ncbi:hypothetical protein BDV93DRAFT_522156 [Ceratobasidium sp. AG-I]|nr:hypothetical protein BDV93DRAFT_522156 [Ceratobasidium sp. AG-I]
MPPKEFFVRMQHGITGGFAPPTPSAIHNLVRSSDQPDKLVIQSMVRPEGTPQLNSLGDKHLSIDDHEDLVQELHSILKELPTEQPPGSEDIYGLDTSIMWGSDDLEWANGGPSGCGGGQSEVQPTADQKAKFKRAVAIVSELTDKA